MTDAPNTPPVDDIDHEILIEGHSYDGIQEYDNPLPGWWKWIFILTILYCIPYTIWYHVMDGNTVYDKFEADQAAKAERLAAMPQVETGDAALFAMLSDRDALDGGKVTFEANCAVCHLKDGGGLVGPNLTDDHWINVKTLKDISHIVEVGVLEKGMTPWKDILTPKQIAEVSAYTASLRGTVPEKPKDAEGEVIPPWGP
ncbi:MAG: cbb3-type cytochrome c oxidase N-terminal domain-containing protein [Planctomycetota bacterium]|jgi:cytochrome c oxidase cbb3-type subunit 3